MAVYRRVEKSPAACTPESTMGPTLANEYVKTLPFALFSSACSWWSEGWNLFCIPDVVHGSSYLLYPHLGPEYYGEPVSVCLVAYLKTTRPDFTKFSVQVSGHGSVLRRSDDTLRYVLIVSWMTYVTYGFMDWVVVSAAAFCMGLLRVYTTLCAVGCILS